MQRVMILLFAPLVRWRQRVTLKRKLKLMEACIFPKSFTELRCEWTVECSLWQRGVVWSVRAHLSLIPICFRCTYTSASLPACEGSGRQPIYTHPTTCLPPADSNLLSPHRKRSSRTYDTLLMDYSRPNSRHLSTLWRGRIHAEIGSQNQPSTRSVGGVLFK